MSKIFCSTEKCDNLRQGEILTNLFRFSAKSFDQDLKDLKLSYIHIIHPFSIIITQDCDLAQDFNARFNPDEKTREHNKVSTILFCDLIEAIKIKDRFNSKQWDTVKKNDNLRHQFIEEVPIASDNKSFGLPELTADFKQYYSLPTDFVYWLIEKETSLRRTRLESPYLEHFIQRFFAFQLRVALPEQHKSIPGLK